MIYNSGLILLFCLILENIAHVSVGSGVVKGIYSSEFNLMVQ